MRNSRSSRRDFLKTVAALAVSGKALARPREPLPRRVLIVGGGLAGLAVLDALKAAGRPAVLRYRVRAPRRNTDHEIAE